MSAGLALRRSGGLALRAPGLLGPELPCVILADWLFWDHRVGLSLALFCAAVAIVAHLARPGRRGRGRVAVALLLLAAALAPMVERLTPLSISLGLVGTLLSLELRDARAPGGWPGRLRAVLFRLLGGPRQAVVDTLRHWRQMDGRSPPPADRQAFWLAWVVPLAILSVFAALLADANPLIAARLADLPPWSSPDLVSLIPRTLFWLVVLVAVWPVIRMRRPRRRPPAPPRPASEGPGEGHRLAALLLTPRAVLRALVLLDLLFTLQLALDGAYLWGGLTLPDGMTFAAYAHRGAYPLVATALVAAGFVLVVRRPGGGAPSRLASALLLLFLGQNVLLVVSAIRRLALYVAAYALTEWRVAAFAWMGLVAFGLVLILVQGALGRSNRWLLGRAVLAALAVLYGWCFLDVPHLVAAYDVAHCAELRGEGPILDIGMMLDLGPEAIPAVDRYLLGPAPEERRGRLARWRARAAAAVRQDLADWRGWSLRGWRLARYLDTSGVEEPPVPDRAGGDDDEAP